jgi:hypothetical protein
VVRWTLVQSLLTDLYSEGEYFEYSLVPTSPAFLFLRLADCLAVYSLRAIFRVQIASSVDLRRVLFCRAHTKSQPCTELPSSTWGGYLLDRTSPSQVLVQCTALALRPYPHRTTELHGDLRSPNLNNQDVWQERLCAQGEDKGQGWRNIV